MVDNLSFVQTNHAFDTVARVGGDEFIILLEMPARGGAKRVQKLAEGVISCISEPLDIDDNESQS